MGWEFSSSCLWVKKHQQVVVLREECRCFMPDKINIIFKIANNKILIFFFNRSHIKSLTVEISNFYKL